MSGGRCTVPGASRWRNANRGRMCEMGQDCESEVVLDVQAWAEEDWSPPSPAELELDRQRQEEYGPRLRRMWARQEHQSQKMDRAFGRRDACWVDRRGHVQRLRGHVPWAAGRPRARQRGAGRPGVRRRATRSSARSGDGGAGRSTGDPEPAGRAIALGTRWGRQRCVPDRWGAA